MRIFQVVVSANSCIFNGRMCIIIAVIQLLPSILPLFILFRYELRAGVQDILKLDANLNIIIFI